MFRTIPELLAAADEAAPALLAPDRAALTFGQLRGLVARATAQLRAAGVRREDRVALVVQEGPEAASAFLAAAATAAAAPLNPNYRRADFDFYLGDLDARVLVVSSTLDTPAREAARALRLPVLELETGRDRAAGVFSFLPVAGDGAPAIGSLPASPGAGAWDDLARPEDVALVLHTSGTTSRPKQVPLTHANLVASASNIGRTLALDAADRCLNIMPLFHIHGLEAAVLASLAAGASVICTPGLRVLEFFRWLEELGPTWYTAVPTLHQAILAEAPAHAAELSRSGLRFVRSSSSALPRRTLEELEAVFGVPVVEAYGMTEAAHQMASNPLPPAMRKPGSVGPAAGPEVAVADMGGRLLAPGETGEVVIRGPNVTSGYVANPDANAAAFFDGWFRTGDQGFLDQDGYLFLTGRLKELINRGGEKISPLEVDDALMAHPAVQAALTFALPHPTLGEEVAAAVVLRPGAQVTERQLREFATARLTYYKVPRRIVFLDAIPRGATGKLQRIGLADRLGLAEPTSAADALADVGGEPVTPVQEIVATLWAETVGEPPAGIYQDFFQAGGDSLRAAQLVARLREELNLELSLLSFFDAPTTAGISAALEELLAQEGSTETAGC